ncbi:uncharacterized protein BYT42DRAFT_203899 [Radiomyces spectabilis]|uniref:uncharacterized protein n=1 Tax=Radiomyces spectabilis TaxID=64574 RepID=UPI0022206CB9|nr:uncharacterized protein BYT42DRAFT_203899 [Radiomyces spectabilis]KAI8391673.1 hypothetical protein BYT42DRAFT_203899 [Radiomyces spectabilis]
MSQEQKQPQAPLKLRHPTHYHLMATQQHEASATHPLATSPTTAVPHPAFSLLSNRDSPSSDNLDFGDSFSHAFLSPTTTSPLNDFDDLDYQSGLASYSKPTSQQPFPTAGRHHSFHSMQMDMQSYQPNNSTSSQGAVPIQMHKPHNDYANSNIFLPGASSGSYDPGFGFPMSAPANIGYEFPNYAGSPPTNLNSHMHPSMALHHMDHSVSNSGMPTTAASPSSMARSFEDDYAMQVNMQIMMEKRRRRRESHNAGKHLYFLFLLLLLYHPCSLTLRRIYSLFYFIVFVKSIHFLIKGQ